MSEESTKVKNEMDRNNSFKYEKIQKKNIDFEEIKKLNDDCDIIRDKQIKNYKPKQLLTKDDSNFIFKNKINILTYKHNKENKENKFNIFLNFKQKKNNNNKYIIKYHMMIMIYLINFIFSMDYKYIIIYSYYSNITLKIKGYGEKSIFFGGDYCFRTAPLFSRPNEIYINNIRQKDIKNIIIVIVYSEIALILLT